MTVFVIMALISGWIFIGLISAGFVEAYGRHEWPHTYLDEKSVKASRRQSLFFCPFGLIGLVCLFFMTGYFRHGWTLTSQVLTLEEARRRVDQHVRIFYP